MCSTSMDVGMDHCVPESTCTYKAIYREAMESVDTVIDITSSKCRFRDTVDNPNVRIVVFVGTIFTSLKIVHVLWYGTVAVGNIWTAEAKLRFVIQCVSSPYLS